ncbi:MAG: response regulator [Chitinophagales bacterium]
MKKILLIEDNAAVRENACEILELANYQVVSAEDGKSGIKKIESEQPDLILCDIMMPELDGFGVRHLINKTPKLATIPFIFLTSKTDAASWRKGMELGADDYLFKPFSGDDLLNAIETRLNKNEVQKQEFSNGNEVNDLFNKARAGGIASLTTANHDLRNLRKKQVLYAAGDRPMNLYYICRGRVKTYITNSDGKQLITAMYKAGDFLGYTALLEEQLSADTAEDISDSEILAIPKSEFLALMYSDTNLTREFVKMISHNLREKENQLMNMAYNSLRKRTADGLLQVLDSLRKNQNENPEIEISRRDLAEMIGTTKESLVRTLSDFKEEGLLAITETKITIKQEDKLRNMVN